MDEMGPHWGNWGGGSIDWELWEFAERQLWLWSISHYGSSVRGTWRGGSFAGGPEGYERKALGMGISLYGAPGVDSSARDFEIWLKGALEVECLSVGAL